MKLLAITLLTALALHASAQNVTSGTDRNALLELYTSEGCSSCPPADAWLGELVNSEALWEDIVPVAFHVTYWDALGWPDALAALAHDDRQRRLARRTGSGVYTPGMFRDGEEYRVWRRRAPAATSAAAPAPGPLELTLGPADLQANFRPTASAGVGGDRLTLHVAWLRGASSSVRAGENRGRRLRHEFAVARLDRIPLRREGEDFVAAADLKRPRVPDSRAPGHGCLADGHRSVPRSLRPRAQLRRGLSGPPAVRRAPRR